MLKEGQCLLLSGEEAFSLPDAELRETFCTILKELTDVWGYVGGPANDIRIIAERRDPRTLRTDDMRRIAAENQYWFNVPELRA